MADELNAQALFPELTPEAAQAALRLNLQRQALAQAAAAQQGNAPPPGPPVPAAPAAPAAGAVPAGNPNLPAPRMPGAGSRVVSDSVGPQTLIPGQADVNRVLQNTDSIAPGTSVAVPGGPIISNVPAGARTFADPLWRQQWDAGFAADQRNPLITALGGARYGSPGALPSLAAAAERGISPENYARLLTAGGGQLTAQGHLGVEQQNADTQREAVRNAGNAAQTAADNAGRNQYSAFLQQAMTQHPGDSPAQWHEFASGASGMSTARYLALTSAQPLHQIPGAVSTAPAGTPVVNSLGPVTPNRNALGISTTGSGATNSSYAPFENQLNAASGRVPARPATANSPATPEVRPTASIGEFINRLEAANPGMLARNYPAIQQYMSRNFGDTALESAMRASLDPRQIDRSSQASALSQIFSPFTAARQIVGGPNDEERGLSVLGSLRRAISRAGGHSNFLRQQAQAAGAPPLP